MFYRRRKYFFLFLALWGELTGPVALFAFDLDTRVEIAQIYDDNVTYVKDGAVEDMIAALTAGLRAWHESRRGAWEMTAAVTQKNFADNSDFNNTSQQMVFHGQGEMTKRDTLLINNQFNHADEPRSFQDVLGRATGRYDYFLNDFDVQHVHRFSEQWSSILRFDNEFYDPGQSALAQSVLNKATMEADYALDSRTTLLGVYGYAIREFDAGGRIERHVPEAGWRRLLTSRMSVEMRVGSTAVSYGETSVTKPRYLASLTVTDEERMESTLLFLKEIAENAFSEDPFDIWQAQFNCTRQISRRLKGEGGAFYGKGRFLASRKEEDFIGASIGASFELTRDILARAGYAFSRIDSSDPAQEYTKNSFTAAFVWEF